MPVNVHMWLPFPIAVYSWEKVKASATPQQSSRAFRMSFSPHETKENQTQQTVAEPVAHGNPEHGEAVRVGYSAISSHSDTTMLYTISDPTIVRTRIERMDCRVRDILNPILLSYPPIRGTSPDICRCVRTMTNTIFMVDNNNDEIKRDGRNWYCLEDDKRAWHDRQLRETYWRVPVGLRLTSDLIDTPTDESVEGCDDVHRWRENSCSYRNSSVMTTILLNANQLRLLKGDWSGWATTAQI